MLPIREASPYMIQYSLVTGKPCEQLYRVSKAVLALLLCVYKFNYMHTSAKLYAYALCERQSISVVRFGLKTVRNREVCNYGTVSSIITVHSYRNSMVKATFHSCFACN